MRPSLYFTLLSGMKRHGKTLLLALALLITAVAFWFVWPSPDAIYQGKPMSQWLRELETDSIRARSGACDTLCHAGPIAIPALLEGLHRKDSPAYRAVWPRLPTFIQKRLTPPGDYTLLRHRCAFVLGYIDPTSPKVVRDLRRALTTEDDTLTTFAAQALRMIAERDGHVMPELRSALPELRRLLGARKDEGEQVARAIASIEKQEPKRE